MKADEFRVRSLARWVALKRERSTWMSHYQDLSRHILPRSGRFAVTDVNQGTKKHNSILDSTGTRALRTQSAGLLGGASSPARPWFRLNTPDHELNKDSEVKKWLADCSRIMLAIFAKSNTYRALHSMYDEIGCFGTAATIIVPDFDNVIHHHTLTAGDYCMAANWKGEVDTLYREFRKPVGALVKEFGYNACTPATRNKYDGGFLDEWVDVIHLIEPRADRDIRKQDSANMPWRSCYFELAADQGAYLREGGFKKFPVLAPRWMAQGGDVYGSSPGMDALGDVKQLQHQQLRKAQAIDFMTSPPLQVPLSMADKEVNRLPGGITYGDTNGGKITSLYDVRLDLSHMTEDIRDVRERIRQAFSADLFAMLSQRTNQMTATEVAELHEEKLLMLGPVLDRLHTELFEPLIDSTFEYMVAARLVPTPPPAMQSMTLNVEFVSMLAQAQRAIATNSIDRFVHNIGTVAAFKPDVLDKFDGDAWVDAYSDMLGVDPEMIVANPQVALVRSQRQQAQASAAKTAQMEQAASAAQKIGSVPTQGGSSNMAVDMLNQFSGYNSPSGVGV